VTNLVLNLQELREAISWPILTDICDSLHYISHTVKLLALEMFLHIQEQFKVTRTICEQEGECCRVFHAKKVFHRSCHRAACTFMQHNWWSIYNVR
jgi:hypothetical protein